MSSAARRLRRRVALYDLCATRLRDAWGVRVAQVLGWMVAIAFALFMLVLWPSTHGALADLVAIRALGWLSWVASGLAAWSTARDLDARDEADGITTMAAERGLHAAALNAARWAATVGTTVRVSLGPAMLLAGLVAAMAHSVPELFARILLAASAVVYLLGVGIVLGSLARGSVWLWPRHGRVALSALVLGPWLIQSWQTELWTVPGLFGSWLGALRQVGAGFG